MFKYLFSLLLLVTSFSSFSIELDDSAVNIEDFTLEYLHDADNSLTIDTVQNKTFVTANNRHSPGNFKYYLWHRINIKNTGNTTKQVFLHSEVSYLELGISFYEVKNKKVINKLVIDLQDSKQAQKKMTGSVAIFPLSIKPHEATTVYINSYNNNMRFLSFTLHDEKNSRKTHLNQTLLSSILAGMMLVLTFYHLMFFIVIRNKEYLYYVLYLIGSSLIILQMSGVLANAIGFYYNAVNNYWLLALSTTPLFLSLFIKVIFDTKNTAQYKYENGLLNFMVVVFIIMFVIGLFDMTTAIDIMPYPYIFFFISIILISISMIVKKDSLAHYFLFGTIVFMTCNIINDLYVMSVLPYSLFVINAPGIGITVESIALAFMLSHKLKILQKESILAQVNIKEQKRILQQNVILQEKIASAVEKTRKKDKLLFQQNKLASMGQMLENIAHQWRQPLSQINSSILLIDNYLGEKDKPDAVISSYLDQIETQTSHMSETIDNFRRFHRPNSHSVNTTLKEVIENSLSILHATLLSKRISIQTTIESGALYKGNSEKIQQVFIAILTNAIDALTKSKTTSPRITIIIKELDTEFIIDVCDTAGGISEQEINQVFDKYYSSKDETEYGGLGLYIAKEILEKNQLGYLSVSNDQAGACFKITLYKRAQP